MDDTATPLHDPAFRRVWKQTRTPVLFRVGHDLPCLVRLPFDLGNKAWLRGDDERAAYWDGTNKWWELPDEDDFDRVIELALSRYSSIYVAWEAGSDCQLDWYEATERFTFQWKSYTYRCGLYRQCSSGPSVDLPLTAPRQATVLDAAVDWDCPDCGITNSYWDVICRICESLRPRH